jgi:hypothetical protein
MPIRYFIEPNLYQCGRPEAGRQGDYRSGSPSRRDDLSFGKTNRSLTLLLPIVGPGSAPSWCSHNLQRHRLRRLQPWMTNLTIRSAERLCDRMREGFLGDRQSIVIESFMIENRFCHHGSFG